MALHRRRMRLKDLAKREASGEYFWTPAFGAPERVKIVHAFNDHSGAYPDQIAEIARAVILRDEGLMFLTDPRTTAYSDLLAYAEACDHEMFPTVIEAMYGAIKVDGSWDGRAGRFAKTVSTILREHRISFDFINGQMVEFASREMHTSVVKPTIVLLAGNETYSNVEEAYQNALEEISHGKSDDAITDAGTALQEMLHALGCSGKSLGPLIKSARNRGLLASHDVPMVEAMCAIMNWVSADRSTTGDAHHAVQADIDDAWLTVHVVGALILRLAGKEGRDA